MHSEKKIHIFITGAVDLFETEMAQLDHALDAAGYGTYHYKTTPNAKTMIEAMGEVAKREDALQKAHLMIVVEEAKSLVDEVVRDDLDYARLHGIPVARVGQNDDFEVYAAEKVYIFLLKKLKDAVALTNLGLIRSDDSDLELTAYRKAIQLDDRFVPAYTFAGYIHLQRGDFEMAGDFLTKAIAIDPDYALAYVHLITLFRRLNQRGPALEACDDYLGRHPDNPLILFARANIHAETQNIDQALEDYTGVIELSPELIEAYHNRAAVYKERKQYDLAEKDLLQILEINPDWAEAYRKLGLLYHAMDRQPEAVQMCRRVLELAPDHPNVAKLCAYIENYG